MELKDLMNYKNFVVCGNTTNEEKFAYKIKEILLNNNYNVCSVPYETKSINEVGFDSFVLDLCINPIKGLNILKECTKNIIGVIIQPGAESDEIKTYLNENKIEFVEGCAYAYLNLKH